MTPDVSTSSVICRAKSIIRISHQKECNNERVKFYDQGKDVHLQQGYHMGDCEVY